MKENTWYKPKNNLKVDSTRPVMCSNYTTDRHYLLVPQMDSNKDADYTVIGFNWLEITTGEYNSCAFYKTLEEALEYYYEEYEIYNVDLSKLIQGR